MEFIAAKSGYTFTVEDVSKFESKKKGKLAASRNGRQAKASGTYSASDIQAVKTLLAKPDAKKAKALIDLMG